MTDMIRQWADMALQVAGQDPLLAACILAAATLITEDGALLVGSLLVGSGLMDALSVITALVAGLVIGDTALYLLGWFARESNHLARLVPVRRRGRLERWLDGRQTAVLFLSRFMPGTRFITYVSFGFLRLSLVRFVGILAVAATFWTTAMVLFISEIQAAIRHVGPALSTFIAALVALLVLIGLPAFLKRAGIMPSPPDSTPAGDNRHE